MMGACKVIAIDHFAERLKLTRKTSGATIIKYTQDDLIVLEAVCDLTGGMSPGSCIDRAPLYKSMGYGKIDPSFLMSRRTGVEQVPQTFKVWQCH